MERKKLQEKKYDKRKNKLEIFKNNGQASWSFLFCYPSCKYFVGLLYL